MSKATNLNWGDRLALVDHYKPTIEEACAVFGVTTGEFETARDLQSKGQFRSSENLDVSSYSPLFSTASNVEASTVVTTDRAPARKSTVTSIKAAPESATAKTHDTKKRGRKGDNILQAFSSIPNNPTPAEAFAKQYGVSLAVLRQSKRFDKVGGGDVCVKKEKASGTLMIWRQPV